MAEHNGSAKGLRPRHVLTVKAAGVRPDLITSHGDTVFLPNDLLYLSTVDTRQVSGGYTVSGMTPCHEHTVGPTGNWGRRRLWFILF